jgi:DNA-binding transcriptional MerR regulator
MQPKELAQLLGVTSNTIRRWCDEFHRYLSPTASPPKGKPRILAPHDQRVLHYVAGARDSGNPIETIQARLDAMQDNDWADLPDVPVEWGQRNETVAAPVAARVTHDAAQIAALQRDLAHTQQQLQVATERADQLQMELDSLRDEKDADQAKIHALELDLAKVQGEVQTLRARLSSYALTGDRPLPLVVLVGVTAAVVVVLVIVLLVVVRLVL